MTVEVNQPRQMVQLLEMILIEIGEEARGADRVAGDLEVVDVMIPVVADLRVIGGHCSLL